MPTMQVVGASTGLAVIATALAYIIVLEILKRAGATNLNLVTLIFAPNAILMGWLVLD